MSDVIYARLSLDKTGAGLAVDRQVSEVIEPFDLTPDTPIYADNDVSATSGAVRKDYQRLLTDIRRGYVNRVNVWHTDRLWRLPRDLEDFIDVAQEHDVPARAKQAGFIDLSTPGGRVAARIGVSIAKYEVEIKSERQKARNLQHAQAGKPFITHERPYGYEADCVTIRQDEAEGYRLMAKLIVTGSSFTETARQLNERGYRTANGKPWLTLTVARLLKNPRYAGIRHYQGQDYKAAWPAIVTDDEWAQLQLVLRMRSEASTRPIARKYLLTGILYCSKCGTALSGCRTIAHRDKTVRRVYICIGCKGISRNADALDLFVHECIIYRLDTPALAKLLTRSDAESITARNLLEQRKLKVDRKAALADDFGDGTLSKPEYLRQKARLDQAIAELDTELATLQRGQTIQLRAGEQVAEAWDANSTGWKRQLLELLIKRIEVMPSPRGAVKKADYYKGFRFNPNSIVIHWLN
jgi:site-specific DNA recombinase